MSIAMLVAGSAIMGTLGLIHLCYTFFTVKFHARDPQLTARLTQVSPVLTARTTMWKAWIGFNASHSLGAILFAAVYGYLALFQHSLLMSSAYLITLSLLFLFSWLALGIVYWFAVPLTGIVIATALFIAGYLLA